MGAGCGWELGLRWVWDGFALGPGWVCGGFGMGHFFGVWFFVFMAMVGFQENKDVFVFNRGAQVTGEAQGCCWPICVP